MKKINEITLTKEEAMEILGFRKNDVILKAGLNEFRRAYKKWLKDPNITKEIKETVEQSLKAIEVLIDE